jgi:hypothetical protein
LLDAGGEFAHGLFCNFENFSASEGSFGLVNGGKHFRTGTLSLFPERDVLASRAFLLAGRASHKVQSQAERTILNLGTPRSVCSGSVLSE